MDYPPNEALILDHIQRRVPMAPRPFAVIARETGIDEDQVIRVISKLKTRRIIRNIAAIFNPKRLGYTTGLVGMEIPEARLNDGAAVINGHPGVSHNYLRNHRYNVWFTLAEEDENRFGKSVDGLTHCVGATDVVVLKNEQVFKIGVRLPMGSQSPPSNETPLETIPDESASAVHLTEEEKNAVLLLQQDLPASPKPFQRLIEKNRIAISEAGLLEIGRSLEQRGIMRRYAAVLKHINAGFKHNAMTVWKLPDEKRSRPAIDPFMQEPAVSHLYTRTVIPGKWEYPLFAMIHARSDNELTGIIQRLSREAGMTEYQALNSLKELKKQRVVYFSGEFETWHAEMNSSIYKGSP